MPEISRLLIIEDEAPIARGLVDFFTHCGFHAESEANGRAGLEKALAGGYDMILLDVMLPEMDGFEICNRIREANRTQPIIMLTAKTSEEDIVKGLSLGADDYVSKPFSIDALKARVEAVLRRVGRGPVKHGTFHIAGLEVDPKNLQGMRGSEAIPFSRREMDILLYLRDHNDRPVSRIELLREVWGYQNPEMIETRTVDIHITKLRRKLKDDAATPKHLVTIRGEGYRLVP